LLAAMHRICSPGPKTAVADWYRQAILSSLWGFEPERFYPPSLLGLLRVPIGLATIQIEKSFISKEIAQRVLHGHSANAALGQEKTPPVLHYPSITACSP
jgi:hypothetical protein